MKWSLEKRNFPILLTVTNCLMPVSLLTKWKGTGETRENWGKEGYEKHLGVWAKKKSILHLPICLKKKKQQKNKKQKKQIDSQTVLLDIFHPKRVNSVTKEVIFNFGLKDMSFLPLILKKSP